MDYAVLPPRPRPPPVRCAEVRRPYEVQPELTLDVVRIVRVDPLPPPLPWDTVLAELNGFLWRPASDWNPTTRAPRVWGNALTSGPSHAWLDEEVCGLATSSYLIHPEDVGHERTTLTAVAEQRSDFVMNFNGSEPRQYHERPAETRMSWHRFRREYAFAYDCGWDLTAVRRRVEWPGARGGRHAWTLDRIAWMPIIHELQTMKLPDV